MKSLRSRWRPLPHQAPVLATDDGIDLCVGGVGAGKSQVAAAKVLRWIARHPRKPDGRPARGLVLGKDFRNAGGTQFAALRERVVELGLKLDDVIVEQLGAALDHPPFLRFWNGVEVHAYSGTNPDAARSFEADWLWADEAHCMSAVAFMTALARLRGAEKLRAIVTSNPEGGGWIFPMLTGQSPEWDEIRRVTPVRVYRWTNAQNPHMAATAEGLRAMYRAIRPGLDKQELDGRFLGTDEAPGSEVIDYVRAFAGRVELVGSARAKVVAADLGKTEDFCWFTAITSQGVVVAMQRFNLVEWDMEGGRTVEAESYWERVAERLLRFCADHGAEVVAIDSARGGDQFASLFRRLADDHGLAIGRVEEVNTSTSGVKARVVESLGRAIGLGQIAVPTAWRAAGSTEWRVVREVERLRTEFAKLQRFTRGQFFTYSHPPGGHDDGVVSLALANKALRSREDGGSVAEGAFFSSATSRAPVRVTSAVVQPTPRKGGGYTFR